MMKTREKKKVHSGLTAEQMEDAFASYAVADAKLQKLTATMDEQITKIREKYSSEIEELQETKDKAFEMVQAYATENKADLFLKKKSLDSVHGTLGFRLGTPKIKTLKGFTWPAVTILLKEYLPAYVRTVDEPSKDKLIADRDDEEVSKLFPKVGIAIAQDETFFIELKKE